MGGNTVMWLIVSGLVIAGFGIHYWRSTALPVDGIEVEGTVTSVESRKSRQSGNPKMLHGPTVAFVHPMTGSTVELPPEMMGPKPYAVGDSAIVVVDRESGAAKLPTEARWARRMMFFAAATVVIGLGVFDSFFA